jgi:DNA (cytosine-5)-methyltransferase 1
MAGRRKESDERNNLIKAYIRFIKLVQPKIIFFENVKGFTLKFKKNQEKGRIYSDYVIDRLDKAGYYVHGKLINFADYGIPQKRTRFILIGIRKDSPNSSPKTAEAFFDKIEEEKLSFLAKKDLTVSTTLEDAISDLLQQNGTAQSPDTHRFQAGIYSKTSNSYQLHMRQGVEQTIADSHRFAKHSKEVIERFQYIIENARKNKDIDKEIRDKFSLKKHCVIRLDENEKSPTLTTLPDDFVHYNEPRILTVREYARIQSFPDWFEFQGKYTTGGIRRKQEVPRYTQVGNAIPPLFGEQSGLALKILLNNG